MNATVDNSAIVRRFLEDAWGRGDLSVADELVAEDAVADHDLPGGLAGRAGWKAAITQVRTGLPDLHVTIDDIFGQGDRVAVRWGNRGTHLGELFGVPPTGNHVDIGGMSIFRLVDGQLVEHWDQIDLMTLMRQIGASSEVAA